VIVDGSDIAPDDLAATYHRVGGRAAHPTVQDHILEVNKVPQIVILPHPVFCPDGAVLDAPAGKSVCDVMLENDIDIEHACDRVCACTTCHVIVREGFDSLNEQEEKEEDMLDKAWGLEPNSRLSCQAIVADEDLVVEIPKYTINHAAEKNH
jgi:2Fe-2S ferredoxin